MSRGVLRTFAGGEITPELVARADLAQNQTGLALCENFIVRQNGILARRGGFEHVCTLGRLADPNLDTLIADIIPVTLQNGDEAGIAVGCNFPNTPIIYRGEPHNDIPSFSATSITGTALRGTFAAPPVVGNYVIVPGSPTGGVILEIETVTLVAGSVYDIELRLEPAGAILSNAQLNVYFAGLPFSVDQLTGVANLAGSSLSTRYRWAQDNDVVSVTREVASSSSVVGVDVSVFQPPSLAMTAALTAWSTVVQLPATVTATATVAAGASLVADLYYVASVGPDGTSESVPRQSAAAATNQLETVGNYNTITWTAPASGPTPSAYRIYYAPASSAQRLFLGETAGLSFIHDKRTPIDTVRKPVTVTPSYNNAPAVSYHEQRRWYSGAYATPQTMQGSRINATTNFSSSFPLKADDGLTFRINSGKQSRVRHLVTFIDLLAFTQSNVFRIYSPTNSAMSPTSIGVKPQGNVGSNDVQPVVTPTSVIFAQANGDKLRELTYAYQGNGFTTTDISAFASHLFYNKTVSGLTYTQSPNQIVWAVVREESYDDTFGVYQFNAKSGVMRAMSHVPEYELRAWHRHSVTDGDIVFAVRSLRESNNDYLYAIIARQVPGEPTKYDMNVERMQASNTSDDPYDGMHLDMHVYRTGSPTTTLTKLFHLAGRTVTALCDGVVYAGLTVTAAGDLTLPVSSTQVLVGVPYTSRITTLPQWAENAGTKKNVNAVFVRVLNSNFFEAGPDFDRMTTYQARQVSTPMDEQEPQRTFEGRLSIGPSWNDDGNFCIQQSLPLPLTICGIAYDYSQGG